MKPEKAAALAALGIGCPLMLWASTLYSRADCKIDQQLQTVTPIGYRADAYPLLLLAGLAQGGLAGFLAWQEVQRKKQKPESKTLPPRPASCSTLSASNSQPVDIGTALVEREKEALDAGRGKDLLSEGTGELTHPSHSAFGELRDSAIVSVAPQASSLDVQFPDTTQSLVPGARYFDWASLDKESHIAIVAETGGRKTTVGHWILTFLSGPTLVIDPHYHPCYWPNLPVVGKARNYQQIAQVIQQLTEVFNNRYALWSQGIDSPTLNIVVEEFPAIAGQLGDVARDWLATFARESRKVGLRLILFAQGAEVETWGIKGEGSLRKAFKTIRLKETAIEWCRKKWMPDSPEALALLKAPWPCMVNDLPAILPAELFSLVKEDFPAYFGSRIQGLPLPLDLGLKVSSSSETDNDRTSEPMDEEALKPSHQQ